MRFVLNNIDTSYIILLTIILTMITAVTIYYLLRKFIPNFLIEKTFITEVVYNVVLLSSTILWIFVIISLWESYLMTDDFVVKESQALSEIVMDNKIFPEKFRKEINDAVKQYITLLIHDEWPLMKEGKTSIEANEALERIYTFLEQYTPNTTIEQIFYKEIISDFARVYEFRQSRLEKIESIIPSSLFAMILMSFSAVMLAICFIKEGTKKNNMILLAFSSFMIGINLSIIVLLDYPFSGTISIGNKTLTEGVLKKL